MSLEAWIIVVGATLASWVLRSVFAANDLRERDEIERKLRWDLNEAQQAKEIARRHNEGQVAGCSLKIDRLTAERDAALAAKASQFEAWQSESTNLRADVAALERKCEAMKTDRDRFWSHLDATRDRLASAESDLRAAYAEIALLRPIADSAEKLLDDEKLPGEWAPVRAAIRARKEAGNG